MVSVKVFYMLIFTTFTKNFILPKKVLLMNLKVVLGGGGGIFFKHCIPSIMYNSHSSVCYHSIGSPIDIHVHSTVDLYR